MKRPLAHVQVLQVGVALRASFHPALTHVVTVAVL